MTDGSGQQIAPGWYPDPAGSGGQRWWDGAGWTHHVAPAAPVAPVAPVAAVPTAPVAPVAPVASVAPIAQAPAYRPELLGAAPQVAPGTPTGTVWIWLVVLLPLLGLLPLFFWDARRYMEAAMVDPMAQYTMMLDPWYLVLSLLGWVVYGVTVWFSYLDYAALGRLSYQRRFHWAWSFLWSLVYVIGRTVMVRREADGRGVAPMWAAIAVTVVSIAVGIGWMVWLFTAMFELIQSGVVTSTGYVVS